jgi:uncharacterized protein (DUF2147 family)
MRILIMAVAGSIALAGTAHAQGSVHGDWLTANGAGKVRIAPCADKLCGTIVWLREPLDKATGQPQKDVHNPDVALRGRPVVGMQMIKGFKAAKDGRWTGGTIYDPKTGKTYASKVALSPNGTLKVDGCIAVVCIAQVWTRAR